jgi:hypothetical protein
MEKKNMSSLLNKTQTKDNVYYFKMTLMHVYTIFSYLDNECSLETLLPFESTYPA